MKATSGLNSELIGGKIISMTKRDIKMLFISRTMMSRYKGRFQVETKKEKSYSQLIHKG